MNQLAPLPSPSLALPALIADWRATMARAFAATRA